MFYSYFTSLNLIYPTVMTKLISNISEVYRLLVLALSDEENRIERKK